EEARSRPALTAVPRLTLGIPKQDGSPEVILAQHVTGQRALDAGEQVAVSAHALYWNGQRMHRRQLGAPGSGHAGRLRALGRVVAEPGRRLARRRLPGSTTRSPRQPARYLPNHTKKEVPDGSQAQHHGDRA